MTGKGRPPTGTAVHIRIPDELLAEVDRQAQGLAVSRAEMIRRLLDHAVGRGADSSRSRKAS